MARGVPRHRGGFTFGGRVPPSVGTLLVAILVASVIARLPSVSALAALLPLLPERVFAGEVWRLVTWPLVQTDALSLVFVGLTLWWVASQLAWEWGERTFVLRLLGLAAGAAIATSLVALVWDAANALHTGAWPVTIALVFSWGLLHPGAQLNWFGVVPMTGRTVALVAVFGTALWAIFAGGLSGFGLYLPHLFAIGIAYLQLRSLGGARKTWLRAKRRWFEWRFERKTRHLTVVKKSGKDGDRPRWMN